MYIIKNICQAINISFGKKKHTEILNGKERLIVCAIQRTINPFSYQLWLNIAGKLVLNIFILFQKNLVKKTEYRRDFLKKTESNTSNDVEIQSAGE